MSASDRFVFDTNVLVSALAFPGATPRKAFDSAVGQGAILTSSETLLELLRTLRRPKLARYFTQGEQDIFLLRYMSEATLVEVTERLSLCRDPRDDKFLELAAAGRASHLVTGDRDLLVLDPFGDTRITTPAALLTELQSR